MNNFKKLYDAGLVKRWHTVHTIKEQDLAAHSWGVAMIVLHCGGSSRAVEAALVHDLHESEFGDFPFQTKRDFSAVYEAEQVLQEDFSLEHGIESEEWLDKPERELVKWADLFESYLWAKREAALGNMNMVDIILRAGNALKSRKFPNPRAKELFDEC